METADQLSQSPEDENPNQLGRLSVLLEDPVLRPLLDDLCAWLSNTLDIDISSGTFTEPLQTGEDLCKLARAIANAAAKKGMPCPSIRFKTGAKPGSFQARCNIEAFVKWAKALGVPDTCLFETVDIVELKFLRNVLITLLEIAKIADRYGVEPPELVKLEQSTKIGWMDLINMCMKQRDSKKVMSVAAISSTIGDIREQVAESDQAGLTRSSTVVKRWKEFAKSGRAARGEPVSPNSDDVPADEPLVVTVGDVGPSKSIEAYVPADSKGESSVESSYKTIGDTDDDTTEASLHESFSSEESLLESGEESPESLYEASSQTSRISPDLPVGLPTKPSSDFNLEQAVTSPSGFINLNFDEMEESVDSSHVPQLVEEEAEDEDATPTEDDTVKRELVLEEELLMEDVPEDPEPRISVQGMMVEAVHSAPPPLHQTPPRPPSLHSTPNETHSSPPPLYCSPVFSRAQPAIQPHLQREVLVMAGSEMEKVEEEDNGPIEQENLYPGEEEISALDPASFAVTVGDLPPELRSPTRTVLEKSKTKASEVVAVEVEDVSESEDDSPHLVEHLTSKTLQSQPDYVNVSYGDNSNTLKSQPDYVNVAYEDKGEQPRHPYVNICNDEEKMACEGPAKPGSSKPELCYNPKDLQRLEPSGVQSADVEQPQPDSKPPELEHQYVNVSYEGEGSEEMKQLEELEELDSSRETEHPEPSKPLKPPRKSPKGSPDEEKAEYVDPASLFSESPPSKSTTERCTSPGASKVTWWFALCYPALSDQNDPADMSPLQTEDVDRKRCVILLLGLLFTIVGSALAATCGILGPKDTMAEGGLDQVVFFVLLALAFIFLIIGVSLITLWVVQRCKIKDRKPVKYDSLPSYGSIG